MQKMNQIIVLRENLMIPSLRSHRIVFINIEEGTNIASISYETELNCFICPITGQYIECCDCLLYDKSEDGYGDDEECNGVFQYTSASRLRALFEDPKYMGALSYYSIPEDRFGMFKYFYFNKLKGLNFEFDLDFKICELDHLV